ncbi:MAG: hypothetical protein A2X28_06405 [Elusimicrobia bacterium GWA2_56_46]|nr:MAG: hypothetical protein A2X28_06405 [Elusimicrobia bacterium GWA2_56_46]OGR54915.1 MAG: hypothetical protein A2X39_11585 [Elusimicrobia bacterium GWC2_56_31]HBW23289.1 hypothetical protein [Elusimicrobiota bacterium]
MNHGEFEKLKKRVFRFRELKNAISWSNRSKWPGYIIHGDDGSYWTCRPVDFDRLIKAGYEAAPIV